MDDQHRDTEHLRRREEGGVGAGAAFDRECLGRCWIITPLIIGSLVLWLGALTPSGTAWAVPPCNDSTPPDLTITSPARAAMLEFGGTADTVVTVEGMASDAESVIVSIVVNGQEVLGMPGLQVEPFIVNDVVSRWGLNIITASATDACGNQRKIVQAYLRSGAYFPAATSPDVAARAPHAVVVRLNAEALDDGDGSDADDVRTLINAALDTVDLNSTVPNTISTNNFPIGDCSAFEFKFGTRVTRNGEIKGGQPTLNSLTADPGALHVNVSLTTVMIPIRVEADACLSFVNIPTVTLFATIGATNPSVSADVKASIMNGHAVVDVTNVVATVPVTLVLDCPDDQPAFFCNSLNNVAPAVLNLVGPLLNQTFEGLIDGSLDVDGSEILNSFALAPAFTAPPPLNVTFQGDSGLDEITIGSGLLQVGVFGQVFPNARGPGIPVDALGPIRRNGPPPPFLTPTPGLGVAAKDDLLNQVLWAVWYAGVLDVPDLSPVATALGLPTESLSFRADLPPVLMPGPTPTDPNRVEVGLGEVHLAGRLDLAQVLGPPYQGLLSFSLVGSAIVGGTGAVDEASQKLRFTAAVREARVQVDSISHPEFAPLLIPFFETIIGHLTMLVGDRVLASIEIPLTGLPGSPPGLAVGLSIATVDRPTADTTADFSRFSGDLEEVYLVGDGVIFSAMGEACDDGNRTVGDGCDDGGRIEAAYDCSGEPSVCTLRCGDGFITAGEACDDGGVVEGDGCSASCQIERGYECVGEPSICVSFGQPVPGQQCLITNKLPDEPSQNRITFVAQDTSLSIPGPDTDGDPRCSAPGGGGGDIRVQSETSGQRISQFLPCENWTRLEDPEGYEYVDNALAQGPCSRVLVAGETVSAVCRGNGPGGLNYDLQEGQAQDPVRVEVATGVGTLYCAEFATGITKDGSDGKMFMATANAAPVSCP